MTFDESNSTDEPKLIKQRLNIRDWNMYDRVDATKNIDIQELVISSSWPCKQSM